MNNADILKIEFERKQLDNDAVKWCKENGIPFKSE